MKYFHRWKIHQVQKVRKTDKMKQKVQKIHEIHKAGETKIRSQKQVFCEIIANTPTIVHL